MENKRTFGRVAAGGIFCLVCILITSVLAAATDAPFAIQPMPAGADWRAAAGPNVPVIVISAKQPENCTARATFVYDEKNLYVRCEVRDDSVELAPADAISKEQSRLSQYDSFEFWIGRHQFCIGALGDSAVALDNLRERPVPGAEVAFNRTQDGYVLAARLPWVSLEFTPSPRKCFQLGVQVNDVDGKDKNRTRSTYVAPAEMIWDKPTSYGAAFLNDNISLDTCAPRLAPMFLPEIDLGVDLVRTRLNLKGVPEYKDLLVRYAAYNPKGEVLARGEVRCAPDAFVDLPTGADAGISKLELTGVLGAGEFGPVSREYFSPGNKPLREYRSAMEPPADFDAFWNARLAELKQVPMNATVEKMPQSDDKTDYLKVTLDGWRGGKFVSFLLVPRGKGPYPLYLWVYPGSASPLEHTKPRSDAAQLVVHARGLGEAKAFGGGPKGLYVTDVDPIDCYLVANFLDILRAVDHARTLPQIDPCHIVVGGGSRGGYLTMVLAALDSRFALADATVPCYCDVDLMGRLGYDSAAREVYEACYGGPPDRQERLRKDWQYFDTVNFAHRIQCPIRIEAGMVDSICPAPGIIDAFNRIPSKDKVISINLEHGHQSSPNGRTFYHLMDKPRPATQP